MDHKLRPDLSDFYVPKYYVLHSLYLQVHECCVSYFVPNVEGIKETIISPLNFLFLQSYVFSNNGIHTHKHTNIYIYIYIYTVYILIMYEMSAPSSFTL